MKDISNSWNDEFMMERVTKAYVVSESFVTIEPTCGVVYVKACAILTEPGVAVSRWSRRDEHLPMEDHVA